MTSESRPSVTGPAPVAMSRQDVLTLADEAFLAKWDENTCPECETGTVVQIGPQCRETGHTPYGCTRCRWTS